MINNRKTIFVVSGPAGSGKSTICSILKRHEEIIRCVSCTTRSKRDGEIEGEDYYFISDSEFSKMIKSDDFIEWEYVHDNRYGIRKSDLINNIATDKNILLEIDVLGADTIKKIFSKVVTIFITPPSIKEGFRRLHKRNTESLESIEIRKNRYKLEQEKSELYDFVIINHNILESQKELCNIVNKHIT